jgi:hypothetical protein
MNAPAELQVPTIPGTPFAGGFYVGKINIAGALFALVVAPKAEGEHEPTPWNKNSKEVAGALSFNDGLANTNAMAEAGSKLATWARGLRIGGFDDWYLPSRDELEIIYRNLKPTTEENWGYRSGENPSAVPPTWPYTDADPKQTDAEAFRAGGEQAFETEWYWTSTQPASNPSYAWLQYFFDGYQYNYPKVTAYRARAVRRVAI